MKTIRTISRVIIGLVFIFSGFVKGVDPLGFTYKITDYLEAFHLSWLSFSAFTASITLIAVEFAVGVGLILNIRIKLVSWLLLAFMSFFTVLTLILAIYNPVHDCGCFGDALIITNWQTFFKNLIMMPMVLLIFFHRDKIKPKLNYFKQTVVAFAGFGVMILFQIYSYNHIPIMDFRPYSVGTYIPDKMIIPDDAPVAEYESFFIYKKDGVEKEFDINNLPDSTWEFVDSRHIEISPGYEPPIHDFTIETTEGDDIVDMVLQESKFTFILIAYDLNKTSGKNMDEINDIVKFTKQKHNADFIGLTSSLDDEKTSFSKEYKTEFQFFNTDEITLKTIVRSNPGLILLKNGTIMGKWHHKHLPSIEELEQDYLNNPKYQTEERDEDKLNA